MIFNAKSAKFFWTKCCIFFVRKGVPLSYKCYESGLLFIYFSLLKFHQNYFIPTLKGVNFDEIFKAFFHPLGLGERKMP
ncbi:hypothetical protein EG340_09395 [Chryseobacterium indoltheticum]|uniref:Uncharacterized protein n=1 Tax=Chryseobacterium indoltheticum TaxID=254 RepID=A0A3G6N0C2_9FLAO|nr:hypothetical protein EG340_09395 [Chryseobacterium indoltheticum]